MTPAELPPGAAPPAAVGAAGKAGGATMDGAGAPACGRLRTRIPAASGVTNAGTARDHVLAVVRGREGASAVRPDAQAVTDLLLVTSELVSNAIRHGGGLVAFAATPTREGVRLHVRDRSAEIPSTAFGPGALPAGDTVGGYGWPLIATLARDIAVERRPDGGKIVSVLVPLG
ncbi:ATP-binding protein [Streptomyces sp. NPDC046984]|uniref:ATP-binding protein n=1 Tax=Streptomyces sp. NPDC046984 TaxID=3155138 RepID=UPI003404688D